MNTYKTDKGGMRYQKKLAIVAGIIIAILIVAGIILDGVNTSLNDATFMNNTNDAVEADNKEAENNEAATLTAEEVATQVQDKTGILDFEKQALENAIIKYLQQANLADDTKIALEDCSSDTQSTYAQMYINGVEVDAQTTSNESWKLTDANGLECEYSYLGQYILYSGNGDKVSITDANGLSKHLGQTAATQLSEAIVKFSKLTNTSIDGWYLDFGDTNGQDKIDYNGIEISTLRVYTTQDAQTFTDDVATNYQVQITYATDQDNNVITIMELDTQSVNAKTWTYKNNQLTSNDA